MRTFTEEQVRRILRQQMVGDPEKKLAVVEDMIDRLIEEALR